MSPVDAKKGDVDLSCLSPTYRKIKFSPFGQLNPLQELELNLERQYHMHRLAARYYDYHNFWTLFLPSIILTMVSGVLSFLSTEDTGGLPFSHKTKAIFATLVGCMSVVSVFMQALITELGLNHRAKLHGSVAVDIRELHNQLIFDELECRTLGGVSAVENQDVHISVHKIVKLYEEKFNQILVGAKSALPIQIVNAYALVSSRISLAAFPPVKFPISDKKSRSRVDWVSALSIVHNELFSTFCSYRFWPLFMPQPAKIVNETMQNIFSLLNDQTGRSDNDEKEAHSTDQHVGDLPDECKTHMSIYHLLLLQQRKIREANKKGMMECRANEGTPLLQRASCDRDVAVKKTEGERESSG